MRFPTANPKGEIEPTMLDRRRSPSRCVFSNLRMERLSHCGDPGSWLHVSAVVVVERAGPALVWGMGEPVLLGGKGVYCSRALGTLQWVG